MTEKIYHCAKCNESVFLVIIKRKEIKQAEAQIDVVLRCRCGTEIHAEAIWDAESD